MKILPVILLLMGALAGYAQKSDVAVGKAAYEFVHVRDTQNRDKPYKETFVLLVGRNGSVYKSQTKQDQQEKMAADMREQVKRSPDPNHLNLTITGMVSSTGDETYQFQQEKRLLTETNLINFYLVDEPLPVIKWTISKDTTSFSGLHCQKATAKFKGRNYQAWFCPDLPFHTGPWLFNGLPGLILQIRDAKSEVQFNFAGFEDITANHMLIAPPTDDIKASPADIARLWETRRTDPSGFMKAAQGTSQKRKIAGPMDNIDPSKIQSISVKRAPETASSVVNNPVDLTEKK